MKKKIEVVDYTQPAVELLFRHIKAACDGGFEIGDQDDDEYKPKVVGKKISITMVKKADCDKKDEKNVVEPIDNPEIHDIVDEEINEAPKRRGRKRIEK